MPPSTLKDVAQFLGLSSELQMAAKLKVPSPISTIAQIKAYEKLPPRASFKQDKTKGTPPITVQFTDESREYILKREWKFGDGKTDNAVNPSHTYTSADCDDQFPITLTVSNEGGSDAATGSMWVYPKPPKVKFAASAWTGVSPLQVTFFDETDGECFMSRQWDFGDGTTGTGTNPTHVFHNNTGSAVEFRVSLTVVLQSNNPASWAGTDTGSRDTANASTDNAYHHRIHLPVGNNSGPGQQIPAQRDGRYPGSRPHWKPQPATPRRRQARWAHSTC
jgi:PKD repeat protein